MAKLNDRSEKGLLTHSNCVVTLIDLQPQMLFGVGNFDRQTVIEKNVVLAKSARVFGVPAGISTGESGGLGRGDFDRQTVGGEDVVRAKSARVFGSPTVISTVESAGFSGNLWPQVAAVFPDTVPIERTTMNAWGDRRVVGG